MRVDLFDFHLPPERIAEHPASPRDAARMLAIGEVLRDLGVRDLPGLLRPGDVLVFNDTRVIPARLRGRRGEAKIEILLHRPLSEEHWLAFARPAKRLRPGDRIDFGEDFLATVEDRREGEVTLRFAMPAAEFRILLDRYGETPLPPYIKRSSGATAEDKSRYQTVYARHEGAVAAPTAGLHFTDELLAACRARGVEFSFVTLHVGAGTFQPVKVEDTDDHVMHREWGSVTAEAAETVNRARAGGGRVVAVGTTALRLLESAADERGVLHPFSGDTGIFITPGYRFRIVDCLLTNFHLPKSTLFMLVSAFAGLERMQTAYAHAIREGYRFYSYGDACWLERAR